MCCARGVKDIYRFRHKCKMLRIVGGTEAVLGILMFINNFGVIFESWWTGGWFPFYDPFHIFQNPARYIAFDWLFHWAHIHLLKVFASGVLGICCARKATSSCTINTHMGLSIVSCVLSAFSAASAITTVVRVVEDMGSILYAKGTLLYAIMSIGALVLCIASAALCGQATAAAGFGACCGGGCDKQPLDQPGHRGESLTQPMVPYAPQPQFAAGVNPAGAATPTAPYAI